MLILVNSQLHFQPLKTTNSQQPLFIYLPGLDGTGKLLHTQVSIWQNFDVRCLCIPRDDVSDWKMLTAKVIQLIRKELKNNHDRQVYICGESFGGCLALKLIEVAPELCNYLILINAASSFRKRPWLNFGGTLTQIMPNFIYAYSTLILLPFLAKLELLKSSVRRDLLTVMQSLPSNIVSWRISLLEKFTLNCHQLQQFANPVLIIASEMDQILPSVEESQQLNNIFPNTKTFILAGSGHSCLLEKDVNLWKILQESNFF